MGPNRDTDEDAVGAHWMRFEPPLLLTGGGLDDLIGRHLPGARAVGVDFLDEGVVNANYRVDLVWEGTPLPEAPGSVRLELSRSDEGPLREGALAGRLVPRIRLPRLLGTAVSTDPEPHRRTLFTWIEGRTLGDLLRGAVARGEADGQAAAAHGASLARAGRSLGAVLAVLHGDHPAAFGRFAPDLSVMPVAGAPVTRWADDITRRTAVRLENPAHGLQPFRRESVRTRFARLLAPLWSADPSLPSVVHGDLSPGNIVLKPGDGGAPELSGLIDWEMARASDPAADFASLRFELGNRCPDFVAAVEEAYRAARGDLAADAAVADRERRIALASVPLLLDARMVAWRKKDPDLIAAIDERLELVLDGTGR